MTRWIPLRDVSKRLPGIGRKTLLKAIYGGALKASQVGNRRAWYTSDAWLREWIEGLQAEQATARERNPGRPVSDAARTVSFAPVRKERVARTLRSDEA